MSERLLLYKVNLRVQAKRARMENLFLSIGDRGRGDSSWEELLCVTIVRALNAALYRVDRDPVKAEASARNVHPRPHLRLALRVVVVGIK